MPAATTMTRSPSAEPPKVTKRKAGSRSVSTLTPLQLARKRANDREAQRAIRARTKEHIERLEREIQQLRSPQARDETIQNLLAENEDLRQQLASLQRTLGLQGRPFPAPTYEVEGISPAAPAISSRASSFGPGPGEFGTPTTGFAPSYLPTPEPCDQWQTVVPVPAVSVSSVVSSPCSSTGHPEDYVPGYIPTSVPSSMIGGTVAPPPNIPCLEEKMEFEDANNGVPTDQAYSQPTVPHTPASYVPQQAWPIYTPPNWP